MKKLLILICISLLFVACTSQSGKKIQQDKDDMILNNSQAIGQLQYELDELRDHMQDDLSDEDVLQAELDRLEHLMALNKAEALRYALEIQAKAAEMVKIPK